MPNSIDITVYHIDKKITSTKIREGAIDLIIGDSPNIRIFFSKDEAMEVVNRMLIALASPVGEPAEPEPAL